MYSEPNVGYHRRDMLSPETLAEAEYRLRQMRGESVEPRESDKSLMSTRALSHLAKGWVGQILVKGSIAWETTDPYEKQEDAKAAADKQLATKLAGLFA